MLDDLDESLQQKRVDFLRRIIGGLLLEDAFGGSLIDNGSIENNVVTLLIHDLQQHFKLLIAFLLVLLLFFSRHFPS